MSRRRLLTWAAVLAAVAALWLWWTRPEPPPEHPEDLCAIFTEKDHWYRGARAAQQRWGVPEAVQLAVIHQESGFRAKVRPPRRRILWILPGPRPSSAYGYAQAIDGAWRLYRESTGRHDASRHDFADAADFVAWYAARIYRLTSIEPGDVRGLYLAYHEGIQGYRRGTWRDKAWLHAVARRVAERAARYAEQYDGCRRRLWWKEIRRIALRWLIVLALVAALVVAWRRSRSRIRL